MPSEQEMRLHRCCFSGHRPEKLARSETEVQEWLTEQITNAVEDGYLTFITGMAMGVVDQVPIYGMSPYGTFL